jgi:hypothetical protein
LGVEKEALLNSFTTKQIVVCLSYSTLCLAIALIIQFSNADVIGGVDGTAPTGDASVGGPAGPCNSSKTKKLQFKADSNLGKDEEVPAAGSAVIWGGNAMAGEGSAYGHPFTEQFLSKLRQAKEHKLETFGYFEGKCGNTDGVDTGEKKNCASKGISDWNGEGWKEFTWQQLKGSGQIGLDHCEVDNIPEDYLMKFLEEYKTKFDSKEIRCRLVLKNVNAGQMEQVAAKYSGAQADFISPFSIFESKGGQNPEAAFKKIKPNGKVIVSTSSGAYGTGFGDGQVPSCLD